MEQELEQGERSQAEAITVLSSRSLQRFNTGSHTTPGTTIYFYWQAGNETVRVEIEIQAKIIFNVSFSKYYVTRER